MKRHPWMYGLWLAGLLGCSEPETKQDASPASSVADMEADSDQGNDHGMASCCGRPGDTGNSVGVGKYCATIQDCLRNTKAKICTTVFMPQYAFCTTLCDSTRDPLPQCGEGATCECLSGEGCGCVPSSCRMNAPVGCFP